MGHENKPNQTASQDTLNKLHDMAAQTYMDLLEKYNNGEVLDTNGNPKPPPANLLTSLSKFLKDNRTDIPSKADDGDEQLVAEELQAFLDEADNVLPFAN